MAVADAPGASFMGVPMKHISLITVRAAPWGPSGDMANV
jgi:hypothetical protein